MGKYVLVYQRGGDVFGNFWANRVPVVGSALGLTGMGLESCNTHSGNFMGGRLLAESRLFNTEEKLRLDVCTSEWATFGRMVAQ